MAFGATRTQTARSPRIEPARAADVEAGVLHLRRDVRHPDRTAVLFFGVRDHRARAAHQSRDRGARSARAADQARRGAAAASRRAQRAPVRRLHPDGDGEEHRDVGGRTDRKLRTAIEGAPARRRCRRRRAQCARTLRAHQARLGDQQGRGHGHAGGRLVPALDPHRQRRGRARARPAADLRACARRRAGPLLSAERAVRLLPGTDGGLRRHAGPGCRIRRAQEHHARGTRAARRAGPGQCGHPGAQFRGERLPRRPGGRAVEGTARRPHRGGGAARAGDAELHARRTARAHLHRHQRRDVDRADHQDHRQPVRLHVPGHQCAARRSGRAARASASRR